VANPLRSDCPGSSRRGVHGAAGDQSVRMAAIPCERRVLVDPSAGEATAALEGDGSSAGTGPRRWEEGSTAIGGRARDSVAGLTKPPGTGSHKSKNRAGLPVKPAGLPCSRICRHGFWGGNWTGSCTGPDRFPSVLRTLLSRVAGGEGGLVAKIHGIWTGLVGAEVEIAPTSVRGHQMGI
jgi:hypothetical protein